MSSEDFEECMDDTEWMNTPFILALGIRDDGRTERQDDGKEKFYFIHNPAYKCDKSHIPTEDSDDDEDSILCRTPPPYTVAWVKRRPVKFFDHRISSLRSVKNIFLEPLSLSTPEIVETSTSKRKDGNYVRYGLFPK